MTLYSIKIASHTFKIAYVLKTITINILVVIALLRTINHDPFSSKYTI